MAHVSIIVCTFNRASVLQGFLDRLESQVLRSHLAAEIIIVDNNSTDSTPKVISDHQVRSKLLVKVVHETKQGANYARNAGIRNASSGLLVFTDDDVDFSEDWLSDYAEYMCAHPECQVASGKITPKFLGGRPEWLADSLLDIFGWHNFGANPIDLQFPDYPIEMNMAIRTNVFARHGGFCTAFSRDAKTLMSNDGKVFFYKLARANEIVRYIPCAEVFHLIPPERATKDWVLRRSFWQGVSDARFQELTEARSAVSDFFSSILKAMRLANQLRGGYLSPRKIFWHWRGISLPDKAWYARKAGSLARKIRLK